MVVGIFPLEPHRFGHQIAAYLVVDVGFVGLAELVAAAHTVHLAILDEMGARLVEAEWDAFRHALLAEGQHPVVVAGTCVDTRLAPYRHLLYRLVEPRREVHRSQQRRGDDGLVADGQRAEDGQAVVGHCLVLDGAAHDDVLVALAPVVGHALHEAVDALGEEEKPEVAPQPHHLPAFGAPRVGVLQQEVRREAGEDQLAARYLPRLVALFLDGKVEIAGLPALTA